MSLAAVLPRKLPARYGAVVMPFFLSLLMTCIISGISTVNALGVTAEALHDWPRAWAISWIVAFPTLLVVLPVVRRLTALVVEPPAGPDRGAEGRAHRGRTR